MLITFDQLPTSRDRRSYSGMGLISPGIYSATWNYFVAAYNKLTGKTAPSNPWALITPDRVNAEAYLDGYYNREPKTITGNSVAVKASLSYGVGAWDKANGQPDRYAAKQIPPPTQAQRDAYRTSGTSLTSPGYNSESSPILETGANYWGGAIAGGAKGLVEGLFSEGVVAGVVPIAATAGIGYLLWKIFFPQGATR